MNVDLTDDEARAVERALSLAIAGGLLWDKVAVDAALSARDKVTVVTCDWCHSQHVQSLVRGCEYDFRRTLFEDVEVEE